MTWLDTLLGAPPERKDRAVEVLSWLIAGTTLVALVLFALQQALRLPSHFGVEDWLGWRGTDTLKATLAAWQQGQSRLPAATAYLLLDTALFMPLYGLALLWGTRQLLGALLADGPLDWLVRALRGLAVPSVLALWCVDAAENLGGLARLGIAWGWGVAALLLAVPTLLWLRRWARDASPLHGRLALGWLALSLLAASLAAWLLPSGEPTAAGLFNGRAHGLKQALTALALLPPVGLWLCWWFGLDLDSRPAPGSDAADQAEIRSACRQAAAGVIGRSRYVLAVLALFGAFTLLLDQCRDLLLALASPMGSLWWPVVMAASVVGLAMLSHACWLWARLVGRVKRSGYEVSGLDGVAAWAGEWARSWARLLMLAPLGMTAALTANVAGDAVIAASASPVPGGLFGTLATLAGFALAVVGVALWLMHERRQRALPRPADYYNSVPAVRPLLHDPYCLATPPRQDPAAPPQSRVGRSISALARPVWQPLVALALLLLVRGCMLLAPEITGTAPAALAVLALSLVWWLGPLGLIAMSEQRAVFPWALLLLIAAGVIGLASDNHTLPALVIDDAEQVGATLAGLRRVTLAALALLAVASGLVWLVLVLRSRELLGRLGRAAPATGLHEQADRWRVGLAVAVVALLCAGLAGLDRWAASALPAPQAVAAAVAVTEAPRPAEPLLLVASEGGGVRAAYWTARVLAELQDHHPDWAGRIAAMSGVSGGSMGIAVWRACARGDRGGGTMSACVQQGFGNLDALSPLIAGLMFEDVWMRLLPTNLLCDAASGCGMRSRALAFEREWMRAFPHLAEPLGAARAGEPQLLLNSTVVESGNRALLSTLRFEPGQLPGAEDLVASGRVAASPALVTAAHTSARFPFTNPLASLPHAASGPAAAHLVDGGYHDNSGTASLADLLTLLRAREPGRRVQLVLIRNGQVPSSCMPQALEEDRGEPPPACLNTRSDARELLPPRDAQRLKLYADLLGPALTAFNNLGTGAHGREPVAALTARVSAAGAALPADLGCTPDGPVCLLDQMQDGSLVPLGWTLSPAARAALDARAAALARQLR